MGFGALIHTVKAASHLVVGDLGGAAIEGCKAVVSLAVGSAVKDALEGTELGDLIDSIIP